MRLLVDLTRCQGYGQCAFHAPGAFVMYGDEALMYDPDPDEAQRASILRAAAACPVQAIQLDRADAEPATRAEPATGAACFAPATTRNAWSSGWPRDPTGSSSSARGSPARRSPPPAASSACR